MPYLYAFYDELPHKHMNIPKDYSGRDLNGISFKGTNEDLRGANFFRTKLRGASFEGVDLGGAVFRQADIRGANFKNAILRDVDFSSAQMGLAPRSAIFLGFPILFLILIAILATLASGSAVGVIAFIYGGFGAFCSFIALTVIFAISITKGVEAVLKYIYLSIPLAIAAALPFSLFIAPNATLRAAAIFISVVVSTFSSVIVIFYSTINVIIFILVRAVYGKAAMIIFIVLVVYAIILIAGAIFIASIYGVDPSSVPEEARRFRITEHSLITLKEVGLPDATLKKLRGIKGQGYISEDEFIGAVRREIGEEETMKYGRLIVRAAPDFKWSINDSLGTQVGGPRSSGFTTA